jgi:hypothetical protein
MKISLAHLREHAVSGGWVNFVVFGAKATSGGDQGNSELLSQLTARARATGLSVDQSALAYKEGGRIRYYGTPTLVNYLSKMGIPRWTHEIDI